MSETPSKSGEGLKALNHGLDVLRLLSVSKRPMTATELAGRLGLHQSSVSRILKTLALAGYVRKPDYHSFAADYGVLLLAGNASESFPLATKPKGAVQALADKTPGYMASLGALWNDTIIHLMRAHKGHDIQPAQATGWPLHLSALGLRLLLERPEPEALAILERSRARHGWERPTLNVPTTPEAMLKKARQWMRHDCVVLEGVQRPMNIAAAILVRVPNDQPVALALSSGNPTLKVDETLLLLQDTRRHLEALL
jgi:DNA-binding IclR family transcriptional regulator